MLGGMRGNEKPRTTVRRNRQRGNPLHADGIAGGWPRGGRRWMACTRVHAMDRQIWQGDFVRGAPRRPQHKGKDGHDQQSVLRRVETQVWETGKIIAEAWLGVHDMRAIPSRLVYSAIMVPKQAAGNPSCCAALCG